MNKTAKDLTAGTVGGIGQFRYWWASRLMLVFVILDYRMQTAPPGTYKGMVDCATGILKNEGPLSFYKGTLTPLLGIGLCVSIQFAALEGVKRAFADMNRKNGIGGPDGMLLSGGQLLFAGAAAGLANSVVSGPVEHIRIIALGLQTQPHHAKLYNGPWDAAKKIYRSNGIAGIFKGQNPTLLREATGYGAYFWAYEKLVQREMRVHNCRREDIAPTKAILFGAAAGYALWAVIFPIDMIKSRIQTDGFSFATGQKYKSGTDAVRQIWKAEGVPAFTRGLIPILIRWVVWSRPSSLVPNRIDSSPFANGATFLGFEMASRFLSKY
ncbi:carrier protein [Rhizoctonia solani AG-1 IA]|uniref:Carrier protein n=1 Tax=Thanatephorus cucumeris (strain AG1-IA) TaxID=983506 RepID=L8WSF3_THACA|nr:carrier protein [Rhizoctonia solani AG-1 IA]